MLTEEKINNSTRKHHEFSPSKLQSLEACPGFVSQDSSNEASQRGQRLHDAVENGDLTGLTDEECNVVEKCREYIQSKLDEWPGATLYMEEYLPVDDKDTSAGYLDVGIVNADRTKALVLDWKMGLNPVEPTENNVQGHSYLLGLVRMHPTIVWGRVEFCMPFQGEEGILDAHDFTAEQFPKMLLRIQTIVARAKAAKAAREAGKEYEGLRPNTTTCLFCAEHIKANCTALHRFAIAVSPKYPALVVPDVINPSLIRNPVDAGKALKFFAVMKSLAEAYRTQATNKALTDENFMPEGYQIVSMTRRKIVDNKKFYDTLKGAGFTDDEILEAIEFTLGPVEKIVSNKAPRGKKKAAVEELAQLLAMNGATAESEPVSMLKLKKAEDVPALT